ncbi:MAG: cation:proton antiporter [Ignavibacteriaceae bacterium]|nr:cation:proton antiporter [Ignavibacteriaceae bacterium]
MHDFLIIKDIVIILLISIPIIFLFNKIQIPSIAGFLVTGMIIGPYGFKLISDVDNISVMAEVGVILLLFTIGLEVSLKRLLKMKRLLLITGGLQVFITTLVSAFIFYLLNIPINKSIYLGLLVSLSSTAIVLKLLSDKNELDAPHGRIALAILIFQDLAIIPIFIVLPILGIGSDFSTITISLKIIAAVAVILFLLVIARFIIPKLLFHIANLRLREVFTIGVILLILGTAYLTHSFGLSFALGAFISGLILAESEFSHQVESEIIPLKDAFNSVFFVSVGLLLNTQFVFNHPILISGLTLSVIFLKALIVLLVIKVSGYPLRVALAAGLSLSQIGEFSFVLMQAGLKLNLIGGDYYDSFLASSIFTMILTPFLLKLNPLISYTVGNLGTHPSKNNFRLGELIDHVIIVGFGLNGRNLSRVLTETGIKYVIVELNPDTVKKELAKGERIIYGDCSKTEILIQANINTANIIVFAISDPETTRRSLMLAKQLNPNVYSIVRTRYTNEIRDLISLGADEVIPEEFETSLQIFSKVLRRFHIPLNVIMKQVSILRSESYSMMVKEESSEHPLINLNEILAAGLTETFFIDDDNKFAGKTLSEVNLRAKTDATIIAIVRAGKTITNPSGDESLCLHDTIVITGTHQSVDDAFEYLSSK